jgi:hypothetical protein
MTLDESTRSSIQPLTLNEVVTFFFKGWDILCCLEANFADHGYPKEEVQGFILDASSSFYAEFGLLVRQRVDQWLDQKRADRYSDDLLEGEDDDE